YLPKGFDYPKTPEGEYLYLLAQINFAETPHLESFPEKGILQFYITNDDRYGLPDSEDVFEQNRYRILLHKTDIKRHNMTFYCLLPASTEAVGGYSSTGINGRLDRIPFNSTLYNLLYRYSLIKSMLYFRKPDFNEDHLTTDFNFLPEKDNDFLEPYPVKCSAIQWTKGYVPISKYDYDFYDRIFSELIDNGMIKDGMEDLYEELDEACEWILTGTNCDIQMGGYRFHLSDDPRCCYDSEEEPFDTLLFSIRLVENGSLFFYIQSSALARCDFSKVLYALA
ncbi:MAG: DUF1963 domain-containing protein, partial [Okeania sp. SIO2D1]|nr:DUF1963 domain-containing protein [Okeania sp. SIO2D1]